MISVDLIGQIRRAYFEQERPIKEIVRTLSVSRATARKVIRGEDTTEFRYTARAAQPAPKLGPWIKDLVDILEAEARLPRRERRSTQRLFETLRGRGYEGAHDSVHRYPSLLLCTLQRRMKLWRASASPRNDLWVQSASPE